MFVRHLSLRFSGGLRMTCDLFARPSCCRPAGPSLRPHPLLEGRPVHRSASGLNVSGTEMTGVVSVGLIGVSDLKRGRVGLNELVFFTQSKLTCSGIK